MDMKNTAQSRRCIWPYQVLLSAYSAYLIVGQEDMKDGSALLGILQWPFSPFSQLLSQVLHRPILVGHEPLRFYGSWLSLIVLTFVLIRIASRTPTIDKIVFWFAPVVFLTGPPLSFLFLSLEPFRPTLLIGLLLIVEVMAVGIAVIGVWGKCSLIRDLVILLLHFGIWELVIRSMHGVGYLNGFPVGTVLPLAGSLAWCCCKKPATPLRLGNVFSLLSPQK